MELVADGKIVDVGVFQSDPFLAEAEWGKIVEEVTSRFPGVDLIAYTVQGACLCLASISRSLNTFALCMALSSRGILVFGTAAKVNLMTHRELQDLLRHIDLR